MRAVEKDAMDETTAKALSTNLQVLATEVTKLTTKLDFLAPVLESQVHGLSDLGNRMVSVETRLKGIEDDATQERENRRWMTAQTITVASLVSGAIFALLQLVLHH